MDGKDVPQYKITSPAYINDRFFDQAQVDAGTAVIFYEGVPGPHMQPLNAAAKAMAKQHSERMKFVDPLGALTTIGGAPGALVPAGGAAEALGASGSDNPSS